MFFKPRPVDNEIWDKERLDREYSEVKSMAMIGIGAGIIIIAVCIFAIVIFIHRYTTGFYNL